MSADREKIHELAALYAIGALPEEEARAFECAMVEDEDIRREVEELGTLAGLLGRTVEPTSPPEGLKSRLFDRVRALESAPQANEPSVPFIVRRDDAGFRPGGSEGVESKVLYASPDRITVLLRARPGASLPSHGHVMLEECFVLEGDLVADGGETLGVGDYQAMQPGSVHRELHSREGCLLLLMFSRTG